MDPVSFDTTLWACPTCTFNNYEYVLICDMCGIARYAKRHKNSHPDSKHGGGGSAAAVVPVAPVMSVEQLASFMLTYVFNQCSRLWQNPQTASSPGWLKHSVLHGGRKAFQRGKAKTYEFCELRVESGANGGYRVTKATGGIAQPSNTITREVGKGSTCAGCTFSHTRVLVTVQHKTRGHCPGRLLAEGTRHTWLRGGPEQ